MSRGAGTPPPEPGPDARAVSEALTARLREACATAPLPFDQFMERALYEPGLGYYSAGAPRFGGAGDYTTAAELTPLFGRTLARQCAEVLAALGGGDLLELGAGSGRLAAALIPALDDLGAPLRRYRILEVGAPLRAEQQATLEAAGLAGRVEWLDALPGPFEGVILANEVLDALPVKRFVRRPEGPVELAVGVSAEGAFEWREIDPTAGLAEAVAAIEAELGAPLPAGYTSELCLRLGPWLAGVSEPLRRGLALFLDYGYPRREYYHPERLMGTLICHYRHRAHDDPFHYPGLQDISAFVDFTAAAEAAEAAGLEVRGFAPQAQFLLGAGLAAELEAALDGADEGERLAVNQAVKRLTLPSEMGERFKAIAFGRDYPGPLSGFALADQRHRL